MFRLPALCVVVVLLLMGCAMNRSVSWGGEQEKELRRISAPGGVVDAVVVLYDGPGAIAGFLQRVYIVSKGALLSQKTDDGPYPVLVADDKEKLDIRWQSGKHLVVGYDKARIHQFTSFWHDKRVDDYRYEVEIELRKRAAPIKK